MKLIFAAMVLSVALLSASAWSQKPSHPPPQFTQRVQREVTHRILMLPYYDVFDVIGFKVQGYNLVLFGKVTRPSLKDDAARAMKGIEGVERIDNRIEILPASFFDDDIRRRTFRAIYGYAPLQRYGVGSNRPIHIIVDRGHVTLEGVVDNQGDKNLVNIRANGVPGVFSVANNLSVASSSRKAKMRF